MKQYYIFVSRKKRQRIACIVDVKSCTEMAAGCKLKSSRVFLAQLSSWSEDWTIKSIQNWIKLNGFMPVTNHLYCSSKCEVEDLFGGYRPLVSWAHATRPSLKRESRSSAVVFSMFRQWNIVSDVRSYRDFFLAAITTRLLWGLVEDTRFIGIRILTAPVCRGALWSGFLNLTTLTLKFRKVPLVYCL